MRVQLRAAKVAELVIDARSRRVARPAHLNETLNVLGVFKTEKIKHVGFRESLKVDRFGALSSEKRGHPELTPSTKTALDSVTVPSVSSRTIKIHALIDIQKRRASELLRPEKPVDLGHHPTHILFLRINLGVLAYHGL